MAPGPAGATLSSLIARLLRYSRHTGHPVAAAAGCPMAAPPAATQRNASSLAMDNVTGVNDRPDCTVREALGNWQAQLAALPTYA